MRATSTSTTMPSSKPRVTAYFDEEEVRALGAVASKYGLSMSSALRMLALKWIRTEGGTHLLPPSLLDSASVAVPQAVTPPVAVPEQQAAVPKQPVAIPEPQSTFRTEGPVLSTLELAERYGTGRNAVTQGAERSVKRCGHPVWNSTKTGDRWLRVGIEGVGGSASGMWQQIVKED